MPKTIQTYYEIHDKKSVFLANEVYAENKI